MNKDDLTNDDRFNFTDEELKRLENRWKSDVDLKLASIAEQLQTISRLIWMAVGGTTVIGAMAIFGINAVVKQGERIDQIALKQVGAIAVREAHIEGLKQRDKELQDQIERLRQR